VIEIRKKETSRFIPGLQELLIDFNYNHLTGIDLNLFRSSSGSGNVAEFR